MENSIKKRKITDYFEEFSYSEVNPYRLELLMELIAKKNLSGKKCSLSMDSFKKQTLFFLNFIDGSGVIPLSVEEKTNEIVNAVFYMGLLEKTLNIKILTLVCDRCSVIMKESENFKITNETDIKIIDNVVKIYYDPFHLYKSFMKFIIAGSTEIPEKLLKNLFAKKKDDKTMNINTYNNSFNSEEELNLTLFNVLNDLNLNDTNEKDVFLTLKAFEELFKKQLLNDNLTQAILNNIKTFNSLCFEENFIPYSCTNDNIEKCIKICDRIAGSGITKKIKNFFSFENTEFNFIM
jgi:hypothetical protein